MGEGDRQCSEVPHISTTLAFSTASRGELSGSVKIKKHILIQKIEDMLYHLIRIVNHSLYKALFLALIFHPSDKSQASHRYKGKWLL